MLCLNCVVFKKEMRKILRSQKVMQKNLDIQLLWGKENQTIDKNGPVFGWQELVLGSGCPFKIVCYSPHCSLWSSGTETRF